MNFKVMSIGDRGNAQSERLHIAVVADTNLVYCVIFDTTYVGAGVATPPRTTYWFVPQDVKAGDNVVLYTRSGQKNSQQRSDGKMNHFFFWGLGAPLWANSDSCAVVVEIKEWIATPRQT